MLYVQNEYVSNLSILIFDCPFQYPNVWYECDLLVPLSADEFV